MDDIEGKIRAAFRDNKTNLIVKAIVKLNQEGHLEFYDNTSFSGTEITGSFDVKMPKYQALIGIAHEAIKQVKDAHKDDCAYYCQDWNCPCDGTPQS